MLLEDLVRIKEEELGRRKKHTLRVCLAAGCVSSNAEAVKAALDSAVKEAGLETEVEVRGVGCMKLCCEGPLVAVDPENKLYQKVTPDHAPSLVGTLKGGKTEAAPGDPNHPFFTEQFCIVLENSGHVNPDRIESYIAADGYLALRNVLREMTPQDVIAAMVKSGLRGRGGAGYPTGLKWTTVAKTRSTRKFVICNADEGDPGAFMDRSVLESDPHRVIEGMIIAAYAVGAEQGYIYVRAEYPLAIKRLQTAIRQAKQLGLLGSGIFESPFTFNIDIRIGAGAFVCGEETALMASIEGRRGQPRPRPPFPAESGLVRPAHSDQQRGDLCERAADHSQGSGMVRRHRHREEQRDQGVRAGGQDQQHRADRGPDGDHPAQDRRGDGRGRPGGQGGEGGANRRSVGRLHSGRRSWTRRWTTSR